MQVKVNRLFPHPVLWFVNDDYTNSDFTTDIEYEVKDSEVILKYSFNLDNYELENMINSDKAVFCLHIECPLTMYRKPYYTNNKKGNFNIAKENINHKIEITPLVLANEDIFGYTNDKLNPDYDGLKFDIESGSVLAIAEEFSLYIEKEKNKAGAKNSIFAVTKNTEDEPMKIELGQDRIKIILKEKDFSNLARLQKNSAYQSVVYSMFIVPALIYAFEYIREEDAFSDSISFQDNLWFRSLEKCFISLDMELNKSTIDNKSSYFLAQKLLEEPISHAVDFLVNKEND